MYKSSKLSLWLLGALAALALGLSVVVAPHPGSPSAFSKVSKENGADAASGAISDFRTNDLTSTTVYQQQVTALWATKDLLKVIADQNATIISNQEVIDRNAKVMHQSALATASLLKYVAFLLALLVVAVVRSALFLGNTMSVTKEQIENQSLTVQETQDEVSA